MRKCCRCSTKWTGTSQTITLTRAIAEGLTAADAIRSAFPAGTLSGAPKIRAMEIINELEPVRRNSYAGAVGLPG